MRGPVEGAWPNATLETAISIIEAANTVRFVDASFNIRRLESVSWPLLCQRIGALYAYTGLMTPKEMIPESQFLVGE